MRINMRREKLFKKVENLLDSNLDGFYDYKVVDEIVDCLTEGGLSYYAGVPLSVALEDGTGKGHYEISLVAEGRRVNTVEFKVKERDYGRLDICLKSFDCNLENALEMEVENELYIDGVGDIVSKLVEEADLTDINENDLYIKVESCDLPDWLEDFSCTCCWNNGYTVFLCATTEEQPLSSVSIYKRTERDEYVGWKFLDW